MRATVVDLRYRMNDVLKALERNETVEIVYRGKAKGSLVPVSRGTCRKITEHPFFNMSASPDSVDESMETLRGGRHRDL